MQQELETLKKWIDNSDNIVFFGGAGVSTESGIPEYGRTVQPAVWLSAGDDLKPHIFQKKHGRVLSILPG